MQYANPAKAQSFKPRMRSWSLGRRTRILRRPITPMAVLLIALAETSCTGMRPRNSQFYLPASYNFAFYDTHTRAAQSLLRRPCGPLRHLRGRTHAG